MGRVKKPKVIGPGQKIARSILVIIMDMLFGMCKTLRSSNDPKMETPCIIALFHDELIPLCSHYRHRDFTTIASQNHFGYGIARSLEKIGFEVALGSPSRGGQDAFFQLLRAARKGRTVAFTVDGSRGPRHEMKAGALTLARKAKVPLYLMRGEYKGWRIENTWDKSKLPRPFSDLKIHVERFHWEDYPEDTEFEVINQDAQRRLLALLPDDYKPAHNAN
jgi:lysophospholipid acyltransferase (LPLAT)-like uncharacterized protein